MAIRVGFRDEPACKFKKDGSKKENEAYSVDRALVETLALVFAFFPTDVGLHLNLATLWASDERQKPFPGTNWG